MADSGKRHFEFVRGPVFTNLLLADEINRASPRTQSALLEAMQEQTVTVAGKRYPLPQPFMVFATQNPYESEGTFVLPEAQLDRFLLHSLISYPDAEAEARLLTAASQGEYLPDQIEAQISNSELQEIIAASKSIPLAAPLITAINALVRSTRPTDPLCPVELRPHIVYGASPRAGLSLITACRSLALMQGEDAVRWHHIERLAKPALRHRLHLAPSANNVDDLIDHLVADFRNQHSKKVYGASAQP